MNKNGLIAIALLATAPAFAQNINPYMPGEDEGIAYFLPKTMLEVNVIATKVTYTPGDFCQYANRYLRINDVTSQPESYWEIKQLDVRGAGVPDSTKAYIMKLSDKSVASNIEVTEDGIIRAINTTAPETKESDFKLERSAAHENARMFMTEEILMAGSTAKMAELTAKEIYNIRESKNMILRGQADTMPKDGASLKLIIDNLDKQEKALTELFIGLEDREDKRFTFYVSPEDASEKTIACRFSEKLGVLPKGNLAGEPIYINIKSAAPMPIVPEEDTKGKKRIKGVIYNIPGKGNVTMTFKGKNIIEKQIPVTQFGNTELLINDLFNKKINTRVIFDPTTGSVVKIDKD